MTRLAAALAAMALVLSAQTATAGVIYLDRASFLAGLAAAPDVSEDFEGFAMGPSANPLTIMGGVGEILDTFPEIFLFANTIGGPPLSQGWIANVGASGNPVTIRGAGNTLLGLSALGFDFAHEELDNNWTFVTSMGTDVGPLLGIGPPVLDSFIGWIGAPGETLGSAVYSGGGVVVDNVVGLTAVPEPATLGLLGIGALAVRRRLKART